MRGFRWPCAAGMLLAIHATCGFTAGVALPIKTWSQGTWAQTHEWLNKVLALMFKLMHN